MKANWHYEETLALFIQAQALQLEVPKKSVQAPLDVLADWLKEIVAPSDIEDWPFFC